MVRLAPAPPLGLAYVAAALEDRGVEVRIIDLVALDKRPVEIMPYVREVVPSVVGISCSMAFTAATALEVASVIRSQCPTLPIVVGGSYATFMWREILARYPAVTYVVKREGERTFSQLVECLASGHDVSIVPGICYRDLATGAPVQTPAIPLIQPLDAVPPPARHLLPMQLYSSVAPATRGLLISSRGCPYRCAYCSTSAFHGHKIRCHSVQRVIDEIRCLVQQHGCSFVSFADDTLTLDRERMIEICDAIRRTNLGFHWGCDTRVDLVDPELLSIMHAAGCRVVFFGIESCNSRVLRLIGKGFSLEQARLAVGWTRSTGISAHISFIIGLPGETYDSALRMARFVEETDVDKVLYNILIPYPGCPIFNAPSRYGIDTLPVSWERVEETRPMVRTGQMDEDDVRRAYVYLISHLRRLEERRGKPLLLGVYN